MTIALPATLLRAPNLPGFGVHRADLADGANERPEIR
jgi:hypothetical protein